VLRKQRDFITGIFGNAAWDAVKWLGGAALSAVSPMLIDQVKHIEITNFFNKV
jgi:hypothetical protein